MNKNNSPQIGGIPSPRITPDMLKLAKNLTCSCGGMIFTEGIVFKKISAILSPSGKEEIMPINVMVCKNCNKVNRELLQYDIFPEEIMERPLIDTESITSDKFYGSSRTFNK